MTGVSGLSLGISGRVLIGVVCGRPPVQPIYEPPAFLDIEGLRSGRQPCLRKLAQSRFVVCASPKYLKRHGAPQRPGDLRNHNCLTFNFRRSRAGWPFRQKGRDIEPLISGNLQVNNGETMKQLVLEGVGVARLHFAKAKKPEPTEHRRECIAIRKLVARFSSIFSTIAGSFLVLELPWHEPDDHG
jgi:DNA-binding transcriptional LysR family regulator